MLLNFITGENRYADDKISVLSQNNQDIAIFLLIHCEDVLIALLSCQWIRQV